VFDVSFGGKVEVPSVGILMMENRGDEEDEFWASGITEDLIVKVAGAGLIRVAPMKEILEVDIKKSFEEIAKKLRVKYLLTSSIHKKQDGFDLHCQLIEAESGNTKYANKWSEPIDNAPTIVGNLANNILKSLKVSTKQDVMKAPTDNAEAYEYYLRAIHISSRANHISKRDGDESGKIALELLQKAIELDDNLLSAKNALGWAFLGDTDKAMRIASQTLMQGEQLGDKVEIAKSLNLIGICYRHKGDDTKALDNYNRSIKINEEIGNKGGMDGVLYNIGNIYINRGEIDKAFMSYTRSFEISEEVDDKEMRE